MAIRCGLLLARPREGLSQVNAAPGAKFVALSLLFAALLNTASGSVTAGQTQFLARPRAVAAHAPSRSAGSALQTSIVKVSFVKAKDPGFFRNWGLRAGIPDENLGDLNNGQVGDRLLKDNVFTGGSMAFDFPFLDNLNPQAPMDRIQTPNVNNIVLGGHLLDPLYVSGFMKPEHFPLKKEEEGKGFKCICKVADPTVKGSRDKCACNDDENSQPYHYLKRTPIPGTNTYTLTAADSTFGHAGQGDYWDPQIRRGVVAPADRLPPHQYPVQAYADARTFVHSWSGTVSGNSTGVNPVPAQAPEDRLPLRYARYLDQVEAASQECDGKSPECMVDCKPGDTVTLRMGNVDIKNVHIEKAFVGNALQVSFPTNMGMNNASAVDCPLSAQCSNQRVCYESTTGYCAIPEEFNDLFWNDDLKTGFYCAHGSVPCRTVKMQLLADRLRGLNGKVCRAHFA